ncbi:MAG: hypothetical protein ACRYGF_15105 [Janthinobacterium lividum]
MKILTAMIALSVLVAGFATTRLGAQPPVRGCVLDYQDHYRCNRDEFQRSLAAAHTVRIDTDRLDLFAAKRVREMLQSLGKTVVEQGQRSDLIFDLAPVDRSGRVDLSPAEVALATLTVYVPANGTGKRSRVWVETFDGQTDRPWPSVVIDLLKKFQKDALTH